MDQNLRIDTKDKIWVFEKNTFVVGVKRIAKPLQRSLMYDRRMIHKSLKCPILVDTYHG
jgi:hypothetical protein